MGLSIKNAEVEGLPFLFRGDDFAKTDVRVVV